MIGKGRGRCNVVGRFGPLIRHKYLARQAKNKKTKTLDLEKAFVPKDAVFFLKQQ